MHPTLSRVLKRHLPSSDPLPDALQPLLASVSDALTTAERDRELSAHALQEVSRELEERLDRSRAAERRYRQMFDLVPHPLFVLRRSDREVIDWNIAAERTFGWERLQVIGQPVDNLSLCQMGCAFAMRLMGEGLISSEDVVGTTLQARDGRMVEAEVQGQDIHVDNVHAVLVMVRDVTAQRSAERAERESSSRFQAFFDHAGIAIQLLTPRGEVVDTNPACREMLGYTSAELAGKSFGAQLAEGESFEPAECCGELWAGTRESVSVEKRLRHKDGSTVWAQITVARVAHGDEQRLMAMLQDVTERKRMEQQLLRQAFQDDLTGLANRALFRDRLRHALDRRARLQVDVAVLVLDLDGFKRVNDSLGHAAGDELLQVVGQRIANTVRAGETVARLGGDEFAIVVETVQMDEDPTALAERLLRVIAAPARIAGREVVVQVSVGIATAQPGEDGDTVLRNADTAMYSAKTAGRQCWRTYDPAMHINAMVRMEVEQDLRGALARDEFELHFQPLVRLKDGHLRGFEALIRWRHPRRGLVSPADFLPVAEETGLIVGIGKWVLREACLHAAEWGDTGEGLPRLSVNLAPRQLESETVVDDVRVALEQSGLDPARLILEVTESQVMRAPEAARAKLQAMRDLGVRIAIDDFGTGYSSLSHLQFFPVDELKIDRSFVARVDHGERDASFVSTMVQLAKSLGVEVVAEGIEKGSQEQFLATLGCHTGQGFLYSRPLSPADLVAYLAERTVPAYRG